MKIKKKGNKKFTFNWFKEFIKDDMQQINLSFSADHILPYDKLHCLARAKIILYF